MNSINNIIPGGLLTCLKRMYDLQVFVSGYSYWLRGDQGCASLLLQKHVRCNNYHLIPLSFCKLSLFECSIMFLTVLLSFCMFYYLSVQGIKVYLQYVNHLHQVRGATV